MVNAVNVVVRSVTEVDYSSLSLGYVVVKKDDVVLIDT